MHLDSTGDSSSADYIETVGWDADGPDVPGDTGWFGSSIAHSVSNAVSGAARQAVRAATRVASAPLELQRRVGQEVLKRTGLGAVSELMRAPEMLGKTISSTGITALRAIAKGRPLEFARTVQGGMRELSQNPAWSIAQTGASFIPGVGTAVSSGMATAAAIGRGASLEDAALDAARAALPGGPAVQAAFDVAAGLAKGQTLSDAAVAAAREQVPGGALGKAAFDAGITVAQRGNVDPDMARVVRAGLEQGETQGLFDDAIAAASQSVRQQSLPDFAGLPQSANRIARVLSFRPEMRKMRIRELANDMGTSTRHAQHAVAAFLNRAGRRNDLGWQDVGDLETAEAAALRLSVPLGRPRPRRIVMPRMKPTRSFVVRLSQHGGKGARYAIKHAGLLARMARDTGELTGPTTWTIRSGDFPSGVAAKLTGSGGRWKEILQANPNMSTYTDSNGSTQIKPWQVGQTFNVPGSWVGVASPPPGGNPPPVGNPPIGIGGGGGWTTPPSIPGGPPFSPPSKYPNGYPGPTYTVKSGDYGTKIALDITGDSGRWKELLPLNPGKASAQYGLAIYAGDVLKLPQSWQSTAAALPPPPPGGPPTPLPPTVVGTMQQIAFVQAMLVAFHNKHSEAGFPLSPGFGADVNDVSGQWTSRTQAAMKAFQVWGNLHARGPMNEDGFPDTTSVAALQAQVNADLPGVVGTPPIGAPPWVGPVQLPPGPGPGPVGPGGPPPGKGPPGPGTTPPGGTPPGTKPADGGGGAMIALLGLAAALAG